MGVAGRGARALGQPNRRQPADLPDRWPLGRAGDQPSPPFSRTTLVAYGGEQLTAGLLVYDYERQQTWFRNGLHWQQLATATTPPALREARLVAVPSAQAIYLIGSSVTTTASIETWRFQRGEWSRVATSAGPTSEYAYGFHATYDPYRQRLLFFGGSQLPIEQIGADAQLSADFWSLDPTSGVWTKLSVSSQARRLG